MCANLTVDDEGKRVVNTNGKEIGVVQEVDAGVAYVEPGSEMAESIKSGSVVTGRSPTAWRTTGSTGTTSTRSRSARYGAERL